MFRFRIIPQLDTVIFGIPLLRWFIMLRLNRCGHVHLSTKTSDLIMLAGLFAVHIPEQYGGGIIWNIALGWISIGFPKMSDVDRLPQTPDHADAPDITDSVVYVKE